MEARLEALVAQETPTADKVALDRLAGDLAANFRAAGAAVDLLPQDVAGDQVRARFTPEGTRGGRPALVLCHFDTVWPNGTLARRPYRVEDGSAWGPGTYDMKSGIVIAESALRALGQAGATPARPVTVLLTSDEETGSHASRALIEGHARDSEYALVLESPLADGSLKTARKGIGRYTIEVTGRAVHAGVEPEKGASAIQELAHQVLALHALSDYPAGVSVNVGVVAGGAVSNQVAANARGEIDLRVRTLEDAARIEAAILRVKPVTPGTSITVSGGMNRPPMERTPAIAALFGRARAIGERLGLDLREASTGGASDGNFTAALGIPTLDGLGARGDGAHAEHEHVILESLPERAALLAMLLLEL
jgi:glutamate carboxypeptidase